MGFMRSAGLIGLMALLQIDAPALAQEARLPIIDAHIHYSHDAVDAIPPKDAIAILRKAGLKRALVSSSDDRGTQLLLAEAPDLIVPELRPYRKRSDVSGWAQDETILAYVEGLLAKHRYVAFGEFHVYGIDADLPVVRRTVQLAKQYKLWLHLHGDRDAIERVLAQDPEARILWAHAGFDRPEAVRTMLKKHRRLYADLAFRNDHASGGKVEPAWREAFMEFPDRFLVGTDTYTPERWYHIAEHADWSRAWLADLPPEIAERIGWRTGETLFASMMPMKP